MPFVFVLNLSKYWLRKLAIVGLIEAYFGGWPSYGLKNKQKAGVKTYTEPVEVHNFAPNQVDISQV